MLPEIILRAVQKRAPGNVRAAFEEFHERVCAQKKEDDRQLNRARDMVHGWIQDRAPRARACAITAYQICPNSRRWAHLIVLNDTNEC